MAWQRPEFSTLSTDQSQLSLNSYELPLHLFPFRALARSRLTTTRDRWENGEQEEKDAWRRTLLLDQLLPPVNPSFGKASWSSSMLEPRNSSFEFLSTTQDQISLFLFFHHRTSESSSFTIEG